MKQRDHGEKKRGAPPGERSVWGSQGKREPQRWQQRQIHFDLPTKTSLTTGVGMGGSLCDEWELRKGENKVESRAAKREPGSREARLGL